MQDFQYLDPDVQLAMAYAPSATRDSIAVLFMLDDALASTLRATREPLLARIRLSWWRENLEAMASGAAPPQEPLFQSMVKLSFSPEMLSHLARMTEGWDVLLDGLPLSTPALRDYARLRGRSLFDAASVLSTKETAKSGAVGEAWALARFAIHCRDETTAQKATAIARAAFDVMPPSTLPRDLRPFAVISFLAHRDVCDDVDKRLSGGSPRRILRAARFVLSLNSIAFLRHFT